jgi:superfamily I DNA/RNA helicase
MNFFDVEQTLAITTNKNKVLVAAAAGSGKTTVIVERLKYLLNLGVEPKKIFAITYTNNAAQEMRERINNSEIFIGTIHGLANRILLTNSIDTSECIAEQEFDKLFELISKDECVKLPEVEHLLIDEFQDICEEEYDFTLKTLNPKNFFVVGDSAQSIYGFKGSNYQYFLDFTEDPTVTTYELNTNYRCAKKIVEFGNQFLRGMKEIYKVQTVCSREEAGIVERDYFSPSIILDILDECDSLKDCFVLCRSNKEVESIIKLLTKNGVEAITFKKADLSNEEIKAALESESVKVLTIHSAKGLEAKRVIVIAPKAWNQEEKRICYVAATRARDELYWLEKKNNKPKKEKIISWG